MEPELRRVRGFLYDLNDLGAALNAARRRASADEVSRVAALFASLSATEFLNESRIVLEAVLLGERDLSGDLVGDILEAMATVDAILLKASVE